MLKQTIDRKSASPLYNNDILKTVHHKKLQLIPLSILSVSSRAIG